MLRSGEKLLISRSREMTDASHRGYGQKSFSQSADALGDEGGAGG
jgi:hypothetical protein